MVVTEAPQETAQAPQETHREEAVGIRLRVIEPPQEPTHSLIRTAQIIPAVETAPEPLRCRLPLRIKLTTGIPPPDGLSVLSIEPT